MIPLSSSIWSAIPGRVQLSASNARPPSFSLTRLSYQQPLRPLFLSLFPFFFLSSLFSSSPISVFFFQHCFVQLFQQHTASLCWRLCNYNFNLLHVSSCWPFAREQDSLAVRGHPKAGVRIMIEKIPPHTSSNAGDLRGDIVKIMPQDLSPSAVVQWWW